MKKTNHMKPKTQTKKPRVKNKKIAAITKGTKTKKLPKITKEKVHPAERVHKVRIPISWDTVDKLLEAGCNGTEIAAYIGIHPDTLYRQTELEKKVNFSAYAAEKRAKGDSMLRAKQYESAIADKNISMQIWLGKQRLEQKDKSEVENKGSVALISKPMTKEELKKFNDILEGNV